MTELDFHAALTHYRSWSVGLHLFFIETALYASVFERL